MKKIKDNYEGRVVKGRVEAPGKATRGNSPTARTGKVRTRKKPDIWQVLGKFAGKARGLPADLGLKLDHYLYGVPRK